MKRNVYAGEIHLICVLVPPWLLLVREREGLLYTSTPTRRLPKSVRGLDFETLFGFSLLPLTSLPLLRTLVSIFLAVFPALALATAVCTADYTFGLDCRV
ncbi:hypothetical protein EDD16DRAFT_1546294 [Pisolithus croceorrhizus]|nr:hypothetical protein EDD16DRAFT_1546294 [Pisolithus croceorrhizus]